MGIHIGHEVQARTRAAPGLEGLHGHLRPHTRSADADVDDVLDLGIGADALGQLQHLHQTRQQGLWPGGFGRTRQGRSGRRRTGHPSAIQRPAAHLHMQRRTVLGGVDDRPPE